MFEYRPTTSSGTNTTISYTRDPYGNLLAATQTVTPTGYPATTSQYYYTTDKLNSVILITDTTQTVTATYSYDSWGINTNQASLTGFGAQNPWRYTSGYYDAATHYTKLGARYYNPTTATFTQPDPSHQETNNYTYASNDPINNGDPSGLLSLGAVAGGIFASAVGALVGFAVTTITAPVLGPVAPAAGVLAGASAGGAARNWADQEINNNGQVNWGQVGEASGAGVLAGIFPAALGVAVG